MTADSEPRLWAWLQRHRGPGAAKAKGVLPGHGYGVVTDYEPPVQQAVEVSSLAAVEAFTAAMREAGADDLSAVGGETDPDSGDIIRLWGYPRGGRFWVAKPPAGEGTLG